ncbi:hypothetical protein AOQ84DRAFT_416139 [Glonium stellatum]|uniref:RING-type domain-containing protein n=1 Tax=Glonium stellatum TaxID=574774 RepID=A0A8E2ETR8_9PEZI|nr:hypothetical protein AOQ84DRAFT_416139 [Glonium stellatum]
MYYPPSCCTSGLMSRSITPFKHLFSASFLEKWAEKVTKYALDPKSRRYYSKRTYSTFLSPGNYDASKSSATCGSCSTTTCLTFAGPLDATHLASSSAIFRPTAQDREFLAYALKQSYKPCPHCTASVELAAACNQIHCRCGHRFYFLCARPWQGRHGELFGCPLHGHLLSARIIPDGATVPFSGGCCCSCSDCSGSASSGATRGAIAGGADGGA